MSKLNITKEEILMAVENSLTMAEAARKLNIHSTTLRRYAIKFNCYRKNQGGKGVNKTQRGDRIPTQDILDGKYPDYQTYKLKLRLINEGYKEDKCELCGWDKKIPGSKYTPCELHHLDGNRFNHNLDNLVLICPNCHSLQDHYRSRNKKEHQDRKLPE